MDSKIWIGDNQAIRMAILSLFDVDEFGGMAYFKNCTSIYVYNSRGFDVRCEYHADKKYFESHPNTEIRIAQ